MGKVVPLWQYVTIQVLYHKSTSQSKKQGNNVFFKKIM